MNTNRTRVYQAIGFVIYALLGITWITYGDRIPRLGVIRTELNLVTAVLVVFTPMTVSLIRLTLARIRRLERQDTV